MNEEKKPDNASLDNIKVGSSLFNLQCDGFKLPTLVALLNDNDIVGYALHPRQSLGSAWPFYLVLSGSNLVEFSSVCNTAGDWREVGSLAVKILDDDDREIVKKYNLEESRISNFRSNSIQLVIWKNENVYAEVGIRLSDEQGQIIVISAGVSPGSVSVLLPGQSSSFNPEFELAECEIREITMAHNDLG